ncbi:MAG: DNA oxidative demethylase AlkB [Alphaproteobacteria bacterium]
MSRIRGAAVDDLLSAAGPAGTRREALADGAWLLGGFAAHEVGPLLQTLEPILAAAPFRHMVTPGGFRMSVAMTNCGTAGWVTDRSGYRYDAIDPTTERPWPPIPELFRQLAARAAAAGGFAAFAPDSCLINRYAKGDRLSLHQDRNERDFATPIVSVSLGLPAVFLFGGLQRSERPRRFRLESGDVVVWGGPSRLFFHGIAPLADDDPLAGRCRINLTFRKAL